MQKTYKVKISWLDRKGSFINIMEGDINIYGAYIDLEDGLAKAVAIIELEAIKGLDNGFDLDILNIASGSKIIYKNCQILAYDILENNMGFYRLQSDSVEGVNGLMEHYPY